MDPVLWEEAAQGGVQGLGCGGTGRARGHGRTGVAPRPGLHCTDQTAHHKNTVFKAKKKPVCSGRGFLAVPWVPEGNWTRRSVDGSPT